VVLAYLVVVVLWTVGGMFSCLIVREVARELEDAEEYDP
jgi:hypothetical protein